MNPTKTFFFIFTCPLFLFCDGVKERAREYKEHGFYWIVFFFKVLIVSNYGKRNCIMGNQMCVTGNVLIDFSIFFLLFLYFSFEWVWVCWFGVRIPMAWTEELYILGALMTIFIEIIIWFLIVLASSERILLQSLFYAFKYLFKM